MKLYNRKDINEYFQSLTYDDISLVPTEVSKIKSRKEVEENYSYLKAGEKIKQILG